MGVDLSRLQNVRNETKEELLEWQAHYRPGSPEHIAATVELGRRSDRMNLGQALGICSWCPLADPWSGRIDPALVTVAELNT
jgi:hypothetical protein